MNVTTNQFGDLLKFMYDPETKKLGGHGLRPQEIAIETRIKEPSVRRLLGKMLELGLVKIWKSSGKSIKYRPHYYTDKHTKEKLSNKLREFLGLELITQQVPSLIVS